MRNYIAQMFKDNGLVEVRALGAKTLVGVFDNPEAMIQGVRQINQSGQCAGIYTTLNAPKLRKASNRMGSDKGVRDADIHTVTRLAFDFDPVRPSDVSATREEMLNARAQMIALADYLGALGWPCPLFAMSGNGYHLQYRVNLTPCKELKQALRNLYLGLEKLFTTELVKFDPTVRNYGRIFRLYGTTARKGEDLPERPHRVSQCKTPEPWELVDKKLIWELAQQFKPKQHRPKPQAPVGNGNYLTLDVVSWFQSHGLYKRPLWDNKHAVTCPWSESHSTESSEDRTDTVIFENQNAWPGFYCSHASCEGKTIRDVMKALGDQDNFCGVSYG